MIKYFVLFNLIFSLFSLNAEEFVHDFEHNDGLSYSWEQGTTEVTRHENASDGSPEKQGCVVDEEIDDEMVSLYAQLNFFQSFQKLSLSHYSESVAPVATEHWKPPQIRLLI